MLAQQRVAERAERILEAEQIDQRGKQVELRRNHIAGSRFDPARRIDQQRDVKPVERAFHAELAYRMIRDENKDRVLEPVRFRGRLHELAQAPVGVVKRVEKTVLGETAVRALLEARGQPREGFVRGAGVNVREERPLRLRELAGDEHERVVIPAEIGGARVRVIEHDGKVLHAVILLEAGRARDRVHAERTAP